MISAYAPGVVIGAWPWLRPLRGPRRAMLIGLMILFALGNLLASAAAANYGSIIAARFLAGRRYFYALVGITFKLVGSHWCYPTSGRKRLHG